MVALVLVVWLSLTAAAVLLVDDRTVRFYVYGDEELQVEYGTVFNDPGLYAVTSGNLFGESEDHLPIEISGSVDTGKLGTYTLRYTTRHGFSEYSVERHVTVVDTTPPVIELKHIEGYSPTWMTGYAEEGYTARDNVDGDITGKVQRLKLADRVQYTVSDSSGNVTTVERELSHMSYQPPQITLLGQADTVMQAGLWYTDPGVTVRDVEQFDFACLKPACRRYSGATFANAVSDDESAVFVRPYDPRPEPRCRSRERSQPRKALSSLASVLLPSSGGAQRQMTCRRVQRP